MLREKLHLLGAAAKQQRVAALEPRHAPPLSRAVQEHVVDLLLRRRGLTRAFADEEALGLGPGVGEHRGVHEGVVEHRVGAADGARAAQGEQARVAGPDADEGDQSRHGARTLAYLGPRCTLRRASD